MFETDRRRFLSVLAASGTGLLGTGWVVDNAAAGEEKQPTTDCPLLQSPPVLQCPGENGITVVWAVGAPATGWVEFGSEKDKLDRTAYGDSFGLNPYEERFLRIRIDGLEPNARYYYRTASCPFRYINTYKFERGEPVYGEVRSFTTPGANAATASFSVINDTHQNQKALKLLTDRLAVLDSDHTVWNGDLVDQISNPETGLEAILRPAGAAFAAERPVLFVPGNHDYRGSWARHLPQILPNWPVTDLRDKATSRNFVVRNGPLALIGLDTGEDKPDRHPAWAGLARFEPYRIAQRDWLERALNRPEVAPAPFLVAFCHIPLFDANPNANGGDVLYDFAQFQRQAAGLWGPLLTQHGVQLVVCAHRHRFRFDPATEARPRAQVVGGGHSEKEELTVIHGRADAEKLELAVDELRSGRELGRWTFEPRKKG